MYGFLLQTVYAINQVQFWCLFPLLLCNTKITLASAYKVCLSCTYILYIYIYTLNWLLNCCHFIYLQVFISHLNAGYPDMKSKGTQSSQAGKIKIFGTHPNWLVSYMAAYTKFHLPRPVFTSPDRIFTPIGERASASFPACFNWVDVTWQGW